MFVLRMKLKVSAYLSQGRKLVMTVMTGSVQRRVDDFDIHRMYSLIQLLIACILPLRKIKKKKKKDVFSTHHEVPKEQQKSS